MPLPSQTFGTIPELVTYINTYIIPNGLGEIDGSEHNNVENALANFIVSYTLNGNLASIVTSGGAITLQVPITVITGSIPTSVQWFDNVQFEFYIVNATSQIINLAGGVSYVDAYGAVQTTLPARQTIHIAKATNGSWIQVNNLTGGGSPLEADAQTILGRYATTAGPIQEITIGNNLTLNPSTGVLSAAGGTPVAINGLSIDGSGNVVLGQDLGDSPSIAQLRNNREVPLNGFNLYLSGPGHLVIGSKTDNGNTFQVNGTGYFSGNVGIGQASPEAFLDITNNNLLSTVGNANGQVLANYTPSDTMSGGVQFSPPLRFRGSSFNFQDADSRTADWRIYNLTATSEVFGQTVAGLSFEFSDNGDVYVPGMVLNYAGTVQLQMPFGPTNSQVMLGSLELQSFAFGNAWLGNNCYFNGSTFVYRLDGPASLVRFLGGDIVLQAAVSGAGGASVPFLNSYVGWSSGNSSIANNTDFNTGVFQITQINSLPALALHADVNHYITMTSDGGGRLVIVTGVPGVGINVLNSSAQLHLAAGTAAADTASLKIDAGTVLTTPEAGAVENNGTNFFITPVATRQTLLATPAVTASVVNTVTDKVAVNIGGSTYYLLASTSAT